MAVYKQMTPELLAQALGVARIVHEKSYSRAQTFFNISRETAAHSTCNVLNIDPRWAEVIYALEYIPSPRMNEWTARESLRPVDIEDDSC